MMDIGLKQRIIGALVLIVAAVIFLPMLLSGQDETEQVQVELPAAPVMDETELPVASLPALPEPAPVADIPELPAPVVEPAPPAAPVEPVATPAPAVTPPRVAEPAPATPVGGWVVQQGSFSSQDNAEAFRQTLAGQGYNAYVRTAQVDGKTTARVFVGPVSSREAATRIRDELLRLHKSQGLVVAHDEATRAP